MSVLRDVQSRHWLGINCPGDRNTRIFCGQTRDRLSSGQTTSRSKEFWVLALVILGWFPSKKALDSIYLFASMMLNTNAAEFKPSESMHREVRPEHDDPSFFVGQNAVMGAQRGRRGGGARSDRGSRKSGVQTTSESTANSSSATSRTESARSRPEHLDSAGQEQHSSESNRRKGKGSGRGPSSARMDGQTTKPPANSHKHPPHFPMPDGLEPSFLQNLEAVNVSDASGNQAAARTSGGAAGKERKRANLHKIDSEGKQHAVPDPGASSRRDGQKASARPNPGLNHGTVVESDLGAVIQQSAAARDAGDKAPRQGKMPGERSSKRNTKASDQSSAALVEDAGLPKEEGRERGQLGADGGRREGRRAKQNRNQGQVGMQEGAIAAAGGDEAREGAQANSAQPKDKSKQKPRPQQDTRARNAGDASQSAIVDGTQLHVHGTDVPEGGANEAAGRQAKPKRGKDRKNTRNEQDASHHPHEADTEEQERAQRNEGRRSARGGAKSAQQRTKNWWQSLDVDDPISLNPIAKLKREPFSLAADEQGAVPVYFDGQMLANYLISSGSFLHPVSRRILSRAECVSLDEYCTKYRLGCGSVTEVYDEKERLNDPVERVRMLQEQARSIMDAFFSNRSRQRERVQTHTQRYGHGDRHEGGRRDMQQQHHRQQQYVPSMPGMQGRHENMAHTYHVEDGPFLGGLIDDDEQGSFLYEGSSHNAYTSNPDFPPLPPAEVHWPALAGSGYTAPPVRAPVSAPAVNSEAPVKEVKLMVSEDDAVVFHVSNIPSKAKTKHITNMLTPYHCRVKWIDDHGYVFLSHDVMSSCCVRTASRRIPRMFYAMCVLHYACAVSMCSCHEYQRPIMSL
jgi:hypothetical protein